MFRDHAVDLLLRGSVRGASLPLADSVSARGRKMPPGEATSGLLGAHASAITAYALSLTKAPEDLRNVGHNNLMAMAKNIGGEGVLP